MNTAERIAATYLRLNGFCLLPHFTTFGGEYHGHVDLIGLRAPHSQERANGVTFLIDDKLFNCIEDEHGEEPTSLLLGVIAEVKTNTEVEIPKQEHVQYIQGFLGSARVVSMSFSQRYYNTIERATDGTLHLSLTYTFEWLISRFNWMDEQGRKLTKNGSWTLSEDFLSDILVFRQLGLLKGKDVKPAT